MYKKLVAPVLVNWEVTPICNHNCLHCYNYWRDDGNLEKLTSDYINLNQIIVNELVNNHVFKVIITGGEPLIVLDEIADSIRFLSENGVSVYLNSNLTLLTHEKAKLLKDCGIKSILVSLPSADPETCDKITNKQGSLEKIKEGILIAKEYDFKIFTNMVVSQFNKGQISLTANFVHSLGLTNFSATRASDPSSNREFAKYLLNIEEFRLMQLELNEIQKKLNIKVNSLEANPPCSYGEIIPYQGYKFCSAGKSICTIGYDGNVRPCNRSVLSYGNIKEGLSNIWSKMGEWRDDSLIPEKCSICKLKNSCCGGCKSDALKTYGDMKKADPLCDPHYIEKVNFIPSEPIKLTDKDIFLVKQGISIRMEDFGAIVETTNSFIPISFELAKLLLNQPEIKLIDIMEKLSVNRDSAIETASFLLKMQFIVAEP